MHLPRTMFDAVLRDPVVQQAIENSDFSKISREQLLAVARCCVPELTFDASKGGAGRLAVVGGSLEYTGAPYFAAAAMLRGGADLSHVFCERSAGTAIKSYSPEIIVHPVLEASAPHPISVEAFQSIVTKSANEVAQWIPRLDGILVGPGLGRDDVVIETCSQLIITIAAQDKPLILDADGLFILTCALAPRSGSPTATQVKMLQALSSASVTITPNKVEWERLCNAFKLVSAGDDVLSLAGLLAPEVARRIGSRTTVVVKGPKDVISDGTRTVECGMQGSPRRSGGQGDVLAGMLLTFKVWAASSVAKMAFEKGEEEILGGLLELACAYAACEVARTSAAKAYALKHRGMLAGDVLDQVASTFHELFPPHDDRM